MKILIVHSGNRVSASSQYTFVKEQVTALQEKGVEFAYYGVVGHGISGYLSNIKAISALIKAEKVDLIHAHYGMCGLLCGLQRQVPVVVTYHGSDINVRRSRLFSQLSVWLSSYNIFVSSQLSAKVVLKGRYSVIPCGVDLTESQLMSKDQARKEMHLQDSVKYVLFAGAFDNDVKDYPLARQSFDILSKNEPIEMLELKGYSREEVNHLLCAADVLLMTSKTEGSPQVIKEAMACGCPIVSTDVGDVKERTMGLGGAYVACSRQPEEIAALIERALAFPHRTEGRQRIINAGMSNELVAQKLIDIYKSILHE